MATLILDTETTGPPSYGKGPIDIDKEPRMCALAAGLIDEDGTLIETFYELVKPLGWSAYVRDNCAEAFKINGLSLEILEEQGKPVHDVLDRYASMVARCDGITAFNVAFDQKIIRRERRFIGRHDGYGERPTFCLHYGTLHLGNGNLSERCRKILGIEPVDAHNALADLKMAAQLFAHVLPLTNTDKKTGEIVPVVRFKEQTPSSEAA